MASKKQDVFRAGVLHGIAMLEAKLTDDIPGSDISITADRLVAAYKDLGEVDIDAATFAATFHSSTWDGVVQ